MNESEIRTRMHTVMRETLTEQASLHNWFYEAIRPLTVSRYWVRGQRKISDCSKGCQAVARWSDAPDPMGRHFDAYGNSTTMTLHCDHVDHPSELQVGDYVTFGPYGNDHATCVMERGADPLLWSDGHQGAPNEYRLSYDRRERHYLKNPISHVLTAAEKLRAKTGFWAWVQWRKGVGAWRGHGKSNPKVRPNVPKRIPLKWWRRYAAIWGVHNRGANPPTTGGTP